MVIPFLRVVTVAQMERVAKNHAGNAQIVPIARYRLRWLLARGYRKGDIN